MALSTGGGFAIEIPRFGRGSGGGDGEDLMSGELDSAPSPTSKTQPIYPATLLKNGVGGKVLVSCTIDATGKIVGTSIKSSSGHPDLDKAAINAVNRWKFKPGTKGGKKVKSVVLVPFNFEVKKS
jgi:protein TonB